MLIKVYFYIIT